MVGPQHPGKPLQRPKLNWTELLGLWLWTSPPGNRCEPLPWGSGEKEAPDYTPNPRLTSD